MSMMIYGAIGAVAVLLLLAFGAFLGWALHVRVYRPRAERPDEEAIRREQERQDAFLQMQNYNADIAYGIGQDKNDMEAGEIE